MKRAIKMHAKDNVCVVLEDVFTDDEVDTGEQVIIAREAVKMPHKIALVDIPTGKPVYKYGEQIGYTIADIKAGNHVHFHNMGSEDMMQKGADSLDN